MSVDGLSGLRIDGSALPVIRVLQNFWGLTAVIALGVYALFHTMTYEAPVTVRPPANVSPQVFVTSNIGPFPAMAQEPPVAYLACNQDDARLVRIHDPPPPGRYPFFLRLDQVADQMRSLYQGTGTVFPKDTRLVTTPCLQDMIDRGEFP